MKSSSVLEGLFQVLPTTSEHHAPTSPLSVLLREIARKEIESLCLDRDEAPIDFTPFGELLFPYHRMGPTVDVTNLFDLDELIIFSFYWANRKLYNRVLDAGANLGLHSVLLSKCGFEVQAYEPDPGHFEILERNLNQNNCANVEAVNSAVSSSDGEMEFVKVLGNTTSSHLAGAKENPYGELERFSVAVAAIQPLLEWADLVKMDVEGHEKEVLLSTSREHWLETDALVEIENERNAKDVFTHFQSLKINLFAQKRNWQQVSDVNDMPTSYREGSLFISSKAAMPWPANTIEG